MFKKLLKIQEELKAPKGQRNNFGRYNYRSAEDILEAVKPLLAREWLLLTLSDRIIIEWENSWDGTQAHLTKDAEGNDVLLLYGGPRYYVQATATITDGEKSISVDWFAREEERKKGMDGSQITGASSSYARKYALNGLFLIDDTKDSDFTNTHWKEAKIAKKYKMTKEIFEKAIEHMKTLDRVQRIDTFSQTSLKYDMTEKQYAELKELSESIPFNL